MLDVENLGQVFTPQWLVSDTLSLKQNNGTCLEPSAGDGAFWKNISNCVGLEIDNTKCKEGMQNIDFFDYSLENKFDTIIGNPPFVRYQDILESTKSKLDTRIFDGRSNLYLFFIHKAILHLNTGGELIFITPRDFLKATSSIKLNQFIFDNGTITDIIELGDQKVFAGYSPSCIIWRFEKDNFKRNTNLHKQFICNYGQLLFLDDNTGTRLGDIFDVKVGAVSGMDKVFVAPNNPNATDFICSETFKTGKLRPMLFEVLDQSLLSCKKELLKRKIKKFDETNWYKWGRLHHKSDKERIYVNQKTRNTNPFFTHSCKFYDGSILALIPKQEIDIDYWVAKLNQVNWKELGFVCGSRYIFSQKSLENTII
jgi:adenine-specific DNA-methyltransferase